MEFIRELSFKKTDVDELKRLVTIDRLTNLCNSIHSVTPKSTCEAEVFCIWGTFDLKRDELKCGVRFSLIDCPHAFAWTVTCDKSREVIVIHCALDKSELDADFEESIHEFADDWESGLKTALV